MLVISFDILMSPLKAFTDVTSKLNCETWCVFKFIYFIIYYFILFCLISFYFILPRPINLLIHIIQELAGRPPPTGVSLHFTGRTDVVFHPALTSL